MLTDRWELPENLARNPPRNNPARDGLMGFPTSNRWRKSESDGRQFKPVRLSDGQSFYNGHLTIIH